MPSRRVLVVGVAVGLLAPVTLLSPSHAAEGQVAVSAAKPKLLTSSVNPAVAGERITFTAKPPTSKTYTKLKASQKRKSTLVLQRRDGKAWREVARAKVGKKKKVTFAQVVPAKAAGTVKYRVRTTVGKKTYAAGSLNLKVVAQRLAVARNTINADLNITYTNTLTPARKGRAVTVERYLDGAWSTVATTAAAQANVALKVAAVHYPAWYRVRAAAFNGIPATVSAPVRTSLTSRTPVEVAHRAGAALAPEQTLGALDASIAAGASWMEIDVQLTSDGVPVIVHDATFKRTTDVEDVFPGREDDTIGTFTWAEVQQLDAGSWFGPQWADEGVPSLDQWLERLDGRAGLVLEVKFHPNNTGTPAQADALRAVLEEELEEGRGLRLLADEAKLTFSSFNHVFLEPFAEAHEDIPMGALTVLAPSAAQLESWATWADEVHSQYLFTTWKDTSAARTAGLTTSVWTLTGVADSRTAVASGAERLITDRPGSLAAVLNPPAPR